MSNTKLLSTVAHITDTFNEYDITDELISIDTCNNRIGINTLNPRYSIDITGTTGTIYSYNILSSIINTNKINVDLSAVITDISCTKLKASSIDCSTIPDSSNNVVVGFLYRDGEFIKIKIQ